MEDNMMNTEPGSGSEHTGPNDQGKKKTYGPLIGSEGEVSGYDWDDQY